MPPVPPKEAKKAILGFMDIALSVLDTFDGIENGKHPIVAVKDALVIRKKRKKKEKKAKKLLKKDATVRSRTVVVDAEVVEE